MACEDVFSTRGWGSPKSGTKAVVRSRFEELHEPGRTLIKIWADRATAQIECVDRESFEPFIFGWIALNGWASCVSEEEHDTQYLKALLHDDRLSQEFETALTGDFEVAMRDFHAIWPIFRANSQGYLPDTDLPRCEVVKLYREKGGPHKPACAFRHLDSGQPIPLDWKHTVSAIYQVRCNLFHGQKGQHCENDIEIVSKAYRALARLLPIVIHNTPSS